MKRTPLQRKTPLPRASALSRSEGLKGKPLKRHTKAEKRRSGFTPASQVQRDKVRALGYCVACGEPESEFRAIDPAHLASRATGGCSGRDCVVPLCRTVDGGCHRLFDDGKLDLLPVLEPGFRSEVAHCVAHLGLVGAYRRLTGEREIREGAA